MIDRPFFSVVLPTFNRAWCLRETLDSIAGQTYKDFEVIVLDDGSTDNTLEVVTQHPLHPRYIKEFNNRGMVSGRNLLGFVATGRYLSWIDSDDLYHYQRLELIKRVLDSGDFSTVVTARLFFNQKDGLPCLTNAPVFRRKICHGGSDAVNKNVPIRLDERAYGSVDTLWNMMAIGLTKLPAAYIPYELMFARLDNPDKVSCISRLGVPGGDKGTEIWNQYAGYRSEIIKFLAANGCSKNPVYITDDILFGTK